MIGKNRAPLAAEAEGPGDDLAADVYEGDLHALQEQRAHLTEAKVRREGVVAAIDGQTDGVENRDALWPLIR